jgi:hypothetical protein
MTKSKQTIYARGTLGDAFMIVLKLIANADNITKVQHYSKHQHVYSAIQEIYNLYPQVPVELLKDPLDQVCVNGYMEDHETWEPYPQFDLPPYTAKTLPEAYNVVQLSSGINQAWRRLYLGDIKHIASDLPLAIVGTDDESLDLLGDRNYIDLRNKTTIAESFSVIAAASNFYGPQGLLSFFACSQKVLTHIFLRNESDRHAVSVRVGMIKEWHKHVCIYE